MKRTAYPIVFAVFLFCQAEAHVRLQSPVGGETFRPGDTITIEWQELVSHDPENWDLFYSIDGGVTWDTVKVDIPISTLSYEWVVPNVETLQARIRIVQDNVVDDYQDISDDFTISMIAGLDDRLEINNIEVYPNPFIQQTTIVFPNPNFESHTLSIFNARGQLVRAIDDISTSQIIINREALAKGIYLLRLSTPDRAQGTGKMVIE